MRFTGPLARAARALAQWPRGHVAGLAGIEETVLAEFETGGQSLDEDALMRLRQTLEEGGVVFLPEDELGGAGVRLKFTAQDVKQINRMEGEGGPVGTDDV
ncbi:MAG TPA: DNA-binding protein [Sphingobium sp.]|nr:DNA-binding protein [Sphingobium sp.]